MQSSEEQILAEKGPRDHTSSRGNTSLYPVRGDSGLKGQEIGEGRKIRFGTSMVVQWLRLHTSTAGDMGLIPGWGTKVPHALRGVAKKKKKIKFKSLVSSLLVLGP